MTINNKERAVEDKKDNTMAVGFTVSWPMVIGGVGIVAYLYGVNRGSIATAKRMAQVAQVAQVD